MEIDRNSFILGMINCFAEMVACGVKTLALSPPLLPEDHETIGPLSDEIVREFEIYSYLEKSLLVTKLQSPEFTRGKWSILYFREEKTLIRYLALKEKKDELEKSGKLNDRLLDEISRDLMFLLSYPETVIRNKLSGGKDPYLPPGL
ncbi:MAG TPA: hypothetical protein ENN03_00765 [bacterium]|nr:hypothetical protein [bacterium]